MAFEDNKQAFSQEHFTIVEIDAPVVEGVCTIGSSLGYGTPLTCDQASTGIRTYRFTNFMGTLPLSGVYKCITSISETPTELQSGRGLASRGTLSISMADFVGDPNIDAPAVDQSVINSGGFLAKFDARNILQNRSVRVKNYRIVNGVLPDLSSDAEVRHYIVDTFKNNGMKKWTLSCKDELSRVDLGEKTFPEAKNGYLRQDINDSALTFDVDPDVEYQAGDVIRIGEELVLISSVANIGTTSATVTTAARGATIDLAHYTNKDSHSAGDEVFLCKKYFEANIAEVLNDIITTIGIDSDYIPLSAWQDEVTLWHRTTKVTALYVEAEDANDVLSQFLQSYLLDMWFDPVVRKIKLSAISVWQSSKALLREGVEIDYDSVRRNELEDLRATSALVVYAKRFKARDNAIGNYHKASLYNNAVLSTSDYYSETKQKRFDNNPIIDDTAADLLVRRYISRYGLTPQSYTWKTQENKLSFTTGDIVSLKTTAKVGFDGSQNSSARAQIISVKPNYNKIGRDYTVKALTYDPAVTDNGAVNEIVITGNQQNIDLYIEAGGAIPSVVDITFIIDGAKISSLSSAIPAIKAGNFISGSKITLILVGGADLQSKGGAGGDAGLLIYDQESDKWIISNPTAGTEGGVVYDAQGIDTDIYFSGATTSTTYPTANGFIRAPGGGGGASKGAAGVGGSGGGGGAGNNIGQGGSKSNIEGAEDATQGNDGANGTIKGTGGAGGAGLLMSGGNGGNWGQAGENVLGGSSGGLAGKGVVDSGATVNFYGSTTSRYINGRGDH